MNKKQVGNSAVSYDSIVMVLALIFLIDAALPAHLTLCVRTHIMSALCSVQITQGLSVLSCLPKWQSRQIKYSPQKEEKRFWKYNQSRKGERNCVV